jgi:hypothetical protein
LKGRKTKARLEARRKLWDAQSQAMKDKTRRPGSLKKDQPLGKKR